MSKHTPDWTGQPAKHGIRGDGSAWLSIGDPVNGPHAQSDVCENAAAELERRWNSHDELVAALTKAANELNAIRARDGAPQHISWDRGHPIQTDSCTHEYWDALTEECFAALSKARAT